MRLCGNNESVLPPGDEGGAGKALRGPA